MLLPVVSAPCFVATKLDALADRGRGDYRASHDLEDIVAVVDGRESLGDELAAEPIDLRDAVSAGLCGLLDQAAFREALLLKNSIYFRTMPARRGFHC